MVGLHRVGGHLALDFVNTVSHRGTAAEHDHLPDADAIWAWAEAAGLGRPSPLARPGAGDDERLVADTHALRAAILAVATSIEARAEARPEGLSVLHDIASRTLAAARITRGEGGPIGFAFPDGAATILGPIAWAAVDLFRFGPLDRLKRCPPQDCGWFFLDMTKNRSRRWCSMESCGNREKVRRHRRG